MLAHPVTGALDANAPCCCGWPVACATTCACLLCRRDMHTACLVPLHSVCMLQACHNNCASCLASAHCSELTASTSASTHTRCGCCTHSAVSTPLHCMSTMHSHCDKHPSLVAWMCHMHRTSVPTWHSPVRCHAQCCSRNVGVLEPQQQACPCCLQVVQRCADARH